MGAGIETMTGTIAGFKYARENGLNPWTGGELRNNNTNIQFGNNPNQEYHTFRHTDELGLKQIDVRNAVETNIKMNTDLIQTGIPFNQTINIDGQSVQYTAYKLPNGIINVGRIHGIK